MTKMVLSVVIPAFNEALRLPSTIHRLEQFARTYRGSIELIVANDGSTDETETLAQQAATGLPFRLINLPRNSGPGAAIKAGVLAACGQYILISDADGPVPFMHIERLERALSHGAQVAFGSRQLSNSTSDYPQPLHRRLIGKIWTWLVQFVLSINVRDTQCGFKLFTRESAQRIFSLAKESNFAIHVETVVLAQRLGYKVKEIPVHWDDAPGSKINLIRDSSSMFLALFRIRRNYQSMEPNHFQEPRHDF